MHLHSQMNSLSGWIPINVKRNLQFSFMNKNSREDIINSEMVDESMRTLVMEYIKAQNEKRFADAEVILHEINTIRKLTDEKTK